MPTVYHLVLESGVHNGWPCGGYVGTQTDLGRAQSDTENECIEKREQSYLFSLRTLMI